MNLRTIIVPLCLLLLANVLSAEITVSTRFSQSQVALGRPVQYIVELSATSTGSQPTLPSISSLPISETGGLRLRNGRTSNNSNTSIINGRAEYKVTQSAIIDVIPPSTGTFTIPSFRLSIKGETFTAPAATLVVVENTEGELVFLNSTVPEQLYIGQTTPIELKLYISNAVRSPRIRGYELSADGFAAPTQLPDNERETIETVKGQRYQVITWPLEITPLSAGPQAIEFQFMLSAQMTNRGGSSNSPFGGSMFDDFFGRTERFPVYLTQSVEVLSLPTQNQPEGFSGAIGDFGMRVATDLQQSEVGEPIMLSVRITGEGNFERITGPELPSDSTWKIYSPEGQMEATTDGSTIRSKRFDYVMIPKRAGSIQTPEVRFSFFDPASKEYAELEGPPLTIEVAPSATQMTPTAQAHANLPPSENEIPELNLSRAMTREEALMTLDYQPREGRRLSASNVLTSTWFIATNTSLLIITALAAFLLRKQARLKSDADYAALREISKELKHAINEAAHAKASEDFYRHALTVMRLAISRKAKTNLRTAELPVLIDHLDALNADQPVKKDVATLFTDAYKSRFSGDASSADLSQARTQLNQFLKAL